MKTFKFLAAMLLLLSSLLFTNCTADRDFVSTPKEIISQGAWTVQSYVAGGDKTALYGDYVFTFQAGGVVAIEHTGEQFSGNWKWTRNVQSEVLSLQLPDHSDLVQLDNQWTLKAFTRQTLTLQRDSDVLILQKDALH